MRFYGTTRTAGRQFLVPWDDIAVDNIVTAPRIAPEHEGRARAQSPVTVAEFVEDRANGTAWIWISSWLPSDPASIIVETTDGRTDDVKRLNAQIPLTLRSLGWTGLTQSGTAQWIGFDLDVGHGAKSYATTEAAVVDAHRIREALAGNAEIRLSRSGAGVHVRHWCAPAGLSNADAKLFAKRLVKHLCVQADPSPLGRQCFYFWTATPGPDSFKLIAEDVGLERRLHDAA